MSTVVIVLSFSVFQSEEERNYHIFYEMLDGMSNEEKSKYGLQTAPKYFYLNQVRTVDNCKNI